MRYRSLIVLLALPVSVAAADLERGRALHERHCIGCHDRLAGGDGTRLYTRDERNVRSLEGLKRQVRLCKENLGLRLFDDEEADIVRYLDSEYYHFKE